MIIFKYWISKIKYKFLFIIISSGLTVLFACQKQTTDKADNVQNFTGTFYIAGNDPFTFIAFETKEGKMVRVAKQDTAQYNRMWKIQNKPVRIQGFVIEGKEGKEILVKNFEEIK